MGGFRVLSLGCWALGGFRVAVSILRPELEGWEVETESFMQILQCLDGGKYTDPTDFTCGFRVELGCRVLGLWS